MTTPLNAATTTRWAAAASSAPEPQDAAEEVAASLASTLGDRPADLVFFFFTAPLVPGVDALAGTLRRRLSPGCLAGQAHVQCKRAAGATPLQHGHVRERIGYVLGPQPLVGQALRRLPFGLPIGVEPAQSLVADRSERPLLRGEGVFEHRFGNRCFVS